MQMNSATMAMGKSTSASAIHELAQATAGLNGADLDREWAWGPHDEGLRFVLLGSYHELRDLAVQLAAERPIAGNPITMFQHALGQYHAAYRDFQAALLNVDQNT
jgi:hypothetical protein